MASATLPLALRRALAGCIAVVLTATPTTRSRADPASPAADAVPVDDAQIAAWVEQLDSERFSVRQRAEAQLSAAGPAALAAVSAAARDDSLERSTRAVRILLVWSETGEAEARLAALEQLAQATDTHPTESAFAADQFAAVREAAALEALTRMGAVHNFDQFGSLNRQYAQLQVIIGPKWTGGDEGLALLGELRRIRTLSFHSAPVSEQALLATIKLPSLQRLEIYQTPRPKPETIAALQTARSDWEVAIRSGAQLGIQGDASGGNNFAYVQAVFADTAAARAGIRPGDVITDVDGQQVESFVGLTEQIAKFQPGDTATMTIQRNGQELQLPVTFDRWGENESLVQSSLHGGQVIINGQQRIVIPAPQKQQGR